MIIRTLAALAVAAAGFGAGPAAAQMAKNDYAKPETWLCWPARRATRAPWT